MQKESYGFYSKYAVIGGNNTGIMLVSFYRGCGLFFGVLDCPGGTKYILVAVTCFGHKTF